MAEQRTKLVVYNEHTLGFIMPILPNRVQVLHQSMLRGAPHRTTMPDFELIGGRDKVRLASEKDFEDYRCVFGSFYNKDEYEYAE